LKHRFFHSSANDTGHKEKYCEVGKSVVYFYNFHLNAQRVRIETGNVRAPTSPSEVVDFWTLIFSPLIIQLVNICQLIKDIATI